MSVGIRILPGARQDLSEALAWYDERNKEVGTVFLKVVESGLAFISDNQFACIRVHGDFRRKLLGQFPYAVYYFLEDNTAVISGVIHTARNPRAIRTLLRERAP